MNKADDFAKAEYKDYILISELAKIEKSPQFKKILNTIAAHELRHYEFWSKLSSEKQFRSSSLEVFWIKLIRKILGVTFVAKLIEKEEQEAIAGYKKYLKEAPIDLRKKVEDIINDEVEDERIIVDQIKESRVEYFSSVILGLNDGLIELTGALIGFSFAFNNHLFVASAGFITGVAASLSMASSAYLQARHEEGKDPIKSGIYTGVSYIIVVILLVSPYFLLANIYNSIVTMFTIVALILAAVSYYTSVIFERSFKRQFLEMMVFSVGVALIAFAIGSLFRLFTGINV